MAPAAAAPPPHRTCPGRRAPTRGCVCLLAYLGHVAVVKLLLEKGAELEYKNNIYNWTPLSWAAENGHETMVKLLVEKGAGLESKENECGRTLLLWATEEGHKAMVKMLFENKADANAVDNCGCTAIQLAAFEDHREVEQLLMEKGL